MMRNYMMFFVLSFSGGLWASEICSPVLSVIPSATFDIRIHNFAAAVAWQAIGSSYYLAVGNANMPGPEVRVLQFNPATSILSELTSATFDIGTNVNSVSWQQIASSYYVAVGNVNITGPEVRVLQFNPTTGILSGLATATFEIGAQVNSVAWQQIGSSYYVAVGNLNNASGSEVRVLQFNPTADILSGLETATFEAEAGVLSVAWQQIESSYYLAAGNVNSGSSSEVKVLQFNPNTNVLSGIATATFEIGIGVFTVAWQQIGSSYYLAVGSNNLVSGAEVRVLQFNSVTGFLSQLVSATFEIGVAVQTVAWQAIGNSYYLAVGNDDLVPGPEVRVLEFNPHTSILSELATATVDVGESVYSVAWLAIGSSYYLAVGNDDVAGTSPEVRVVQFIQNCPTPEPVASSNDFTRALVQKYYARVIAAQQ